MGHRAMQTQTLPSHYNIVTLVAQKRGPGPEDVWKYEKGTPSAELGSEMGQDWKSGKELQHGEGSTCTSPEGGEQRPCCRKRGSIQMTACSVKESWVFQLSFSSLPQEWANHGPGVESGPLPVSAQPLS